MSVESILLDFQVTPSHDDNIYIRDVATVATCVADSLRQDCLEQGCISSAFSYASIYSGPKDCMFTIKHYFREGLITLTLEYFKVNSEDSLMYDFEDVERMERLITRSLDARRGNSIPAVRRCLPRSPYLRSSDDRILEYNWTKLLFSERSAYQLVEIYGTLDFGNCLVLDGFINLAESDISYTENLMCRGKYDYTDKEVLILGGGDGALLYELLKEKPKFVTMVDIDDTVMRACKEHMRSVCGDVLDKYDGENYKVIADDAFKYLAQYQEENKKFDVIFGDLTDIPIHQGGSTWKFVTSVIKNSLLLLPVGGKYFTHCIGVNATGAIANFEKMVEGLGVPVKIEKTEDWVPSFMEKWVWFQVTRLEGEVKEDAQIVNGEPESEKEEKLEVKSEEKEKDPATEPKKEEKKEDKKEEKKEEKKDEKKETKGAKEVKDQLEKGKEKGLTKEKSNVDKKTKKTK